MQMKNALELLSQIRIASPCHADWDEMTGDDHVRFCGHCEKNVYNLSALTSEQAFSLIRKRRDGCARVSSNARMDHAHGRLLGRPASSDPEKTASSYISRLTSQLTQFRRLYKI